MLPECDVLKKLHYNTCAVIGSAGLMLTEKFGAEIDQHDAVFRFNIAPVSDFEAFVGSKTTIRLVNRAHCGMFAPCYCNGLPVDSTLDEGVWLRKLNRLSRNTIRTGLAAHHYC